MELFKRTVRSLLLSQRITSIKGWKESLTSKYCHLHAKRFHLEAINMGQQKHQSSLKSKGDRAPWAVKMHQSLLSDATLPPRGHGPDEFDSNYLSSCSLDDLLMLAWDVKQIDKGTTALLIELWRRMDRMSVEQMLSVADIFFINGVHSSWYLGCLSVYLVDAMDSIELTASQLTRLSFHVLDQQGSQPPGFYLALENCIHRHLHLLSLNQLAVICHSFFACQTRIRSMDLVDMISVKLIEEIDSMNNWYLPIFMKTLRFSNFIKISFYKELGDIIVRKNYLTNFRTLAQIMHIAHGFASVRITHPELFSKLLQACCHEGYTFRMKDLSKLIWACGTLVTDNPNDIATIHKILGQLEQSLSLKDILMYPENLVDLCNGLSFLNIYHESLFSKLFHPESIKAVIAIHRKMNKLPQLNMIYHSMLIDSPEYSGNQLDKKSKAKIASLLGSFPIDKEMSLKKGLGHAERALVKMLGTDKISATRLLPHFHSTDLLLVWDKGKSEFIKIVDADSTSEAASENYVRLAVLVLSNMQTSYDGRPMGMLHAKLRQLTTLGYTPVMVEPEVASSFVYNDIQSTQEILLEKIAGSLQIEPRQIHSIILNT